MTIELCCCTRILLDEISNKQLHQRDVALTYALALRSSEPKDWTVINEAIIRRWSRSGLERIKQMAWRMV